MGSDLLQGTNSMGQKSYMGPAPPKGHGLHHYYFWLYALNSPTPNPPAPRSIADMNREQLLATISNSVIEQARLVGLYET
jgi:phosphatidylethanolamine-binding protein (PEBP) family uncharacterized protein